MNLDNTTVILLGFQIGFLFCACFFAWKIKNSYSTPTSTYILAIASLFLMAVWRFDKIFNVFPQNLTLFITTAISLFWMIFFAQIYNLIKKKNAK